MRNGRTLVKIGGALTIVAATLVLAPSVIIPTYTELDIYRETDGIRLLFSSIPHVVLLGDLSPTGLVNETFNMNLQLTPTPGNMSPMRPSYLFNSAGNYVPELSFVKDLELLIGDLNAQDLLTEIADHGPSTFRFTQGSSTQFRYQTDECGQSFLWPHVTLPVHDGDDGSYFAPPIPGSPLIPTARPCRPGDLHRSLGQDPPTTDLVRRLGHLVQDFTMAHSDLFKWVQDQEGPIPRMQDRLDSRGHALLQLHNLIIRPNDSKPSFGETDASRLSCVHQNYEFAQVSDRLLGHRSNIRPEGLTQCNQRPWAHLGWALAQPKNETVQSLLLMAQCHLCHRHYLECDTFVHRMSDELGPYLERYNGLLRVLLPALRELLDRAEQVSLGVKDDLPYCPQPRADRRWEKSCNVNCAVQRLRNVVLPMLQDTLLPRLELMNSRAILSLAIFKEADRRRLELEWFTAELSIGFPSWQRRGWKAVKPWLKYIVLSHKLPVLPPLSRVWEESSEALDIVNHIDEDLKRRLSELGDAATMWEFSDNKSSPSYRPLENSNNSDNSNIIGDWFEPCRFTCHEHWWEDWLAGEAWEERENSWWRVLLRRGERRSLLPDGCD